LALPRYLTGCCTPFHSDRSKIMSNLPPTPLGTSKNYMIAIGVALLLGAAEYFAIWRHDEHAKAVAAAAATSSQKAPVATTQP